MAEKVTQKKAASVGSVFRAYYVFGKKHLWLVLGVLLGGIGTQAMNLAAPLYLRKLINALVVQTPSAAAAQALSGIIGAIFLWWFFGWAMSRIQHFCNVYFESRVMSDLFESSFEYLIAHSHNFFTSHFAGSLTHKLSKYARAFETLFDIFATRFFPTFLFVVGAVVVLFMHSHVLGIALGVWSVFFVLLQIYLANRRQPIRAERAEADTRITASLSDAISNHTTISLFSGRGFEGNLFTSIVETWRRMTQRSWVADVWIWSVLGLSMIAIEGGLLYGVLIFWGRGLLTIGDFMLIQAYLLTVLDQLTGINTDLRRLYDALADAGEMVEILKTVHEVQDAPGAKNIAVQKGEINFKDVSFYFHETRPILEHLDIIVHGGERVALVGPSGAGKSTITKILLRLYDVAGGSIEIDGQNIAHVTQDSLRNAIAFVPQEPILFHRSLMDNIRYGSRDATDAEVMEAAKLAHCHEFIEALPEKYDTFVGERGVKLSGGERQRVAIARAILKNAPILVLDEATSSLDSESEMLIQDALEVLMRSKTVIVIAHRLSTIMKMDRIIVLDGGKVVAEGTHDELLEQGGLYQKLWSIQAGGFLQDGEEEAS